MTQNVYCIGMAPLRLPPNGENRYKHWLWVEPTRGASPLRVVYRLKCVHVPSSLQKIVDKVRRAFHTNYTEFNLKNQWNSNPDVGYVVEYTVVYQC